MISQHLAEALRDAGLRWTPTAGDRFVIPQPELVGQVFTLSEMTIEAREYPTGTILGFNGTTEWALDSVAKDEALWLPREDQLRERLGATFVSLRRGDVGADGGDAVDRADADDAADQGYVVTTRGPGGEREFAASSAADAYAHALLALIALADIDVAGFRREGRR